MEKNLSGGGDGECRGLDVKNIAKIQFDLKGRSEGKLKGANLLIFWSCHVNSLRIVTAEFPHASSLVSSYIYMLYFLKQLMGVVHRDDTSLL